jgi:CheY-like chemotaxis protein
MKIFLVDDDPSARLIATFELERFAADLREFSDGETCVAALDADPDVVVLDIEMPGMDGIAVCRAIRAAGLADTQVLFVSSHDDLETRLAAYDAGGNDYIVKPYAAEELGRKLAVASRTRESAQAANGQAQFAQRTAFAAMSSMAEMGVTQDFLRASFACGEPAQLGAALCAALDGYGLRGLVELRDGTTSHCFSGHGDCTPLETSLLGHARGLERIFQFRDRMAINYAHVTLLIPNLPLEDPDRIGRLRDHLAVLAEGAEARFLAMLGETRRQAQAAIVLAAVADLTASLAHIEALQAEHRVSVLAIAHQQTEALSRAFVHLGLTQGQEELLMALTQDGIDRVSGLQDDAIAIGQRLRHVTERLKGIASEDKQAHQDKRQRV